MTSKITFRLFSLVILLTSSTIAAIACIGNITDPGSNMLFVSHIFSMDTTYNSPNLMWRAISSPTFHWLGFGVIVVIEFCIIVLGFTALYKLLKNIKADEKTYDKFKTNAFLAFGLAVFVWGFIFQAAGAEWFASWQSESWNGLRDATRITMLALVGGLAIKLS